MFNPGRYNITVVKGTTFTLSPVWKIDNLAVDITGYSATMQVRDVSNSLITEMSTSNGKAVISGALGQVTFTLSASATAALTAGTYTYGYNLTDTTGNVYQILAGNFTVTTSAVQ
jgi:hypothetical protein